MSDCKKQKLAHYPAPRDGIDWKNLGFCLATRDTKMVIATCKADGKWSAVEAKPYGPLALEPSATILNYGQGVFEGMKAYRTEKGRIVIFRPKANSARMAEGAERMQMPAVPEELFLEAVSLLVRENADWVPPGDQGSFYMRPLLFGSGAELGVKASPEYTFVIFASPVSSYFSGGGARMRFLREHHRAAPLGVGACKAPGNYAPCMLHQKNARAAGFSDVIYLDTEGKSIEEAAASNFFCVRDGALLTPDLGTILPGITRDSVLRIARDEGLEVREGKVGLEDAFASTEAFVTGTGAGIAYIEHIANGEDSKDLATPGPVTSKLSKLLDDIRLERSQDKYHWLHDPFAQ